MGSRQFLPGGQRAGIASKKGPLFHFREEPIMPATDSDLPLVITMWETYGSNMEPVAARVGQLLGIPVYAQAFSSEDIEALAEEDTDGRAAKLTQRLSTGATPAEMSSHEVAAAGKAHARECTSFVTEKAQGAA
jgi:hypothetical protein